MGEESISTCTRGYRYIGYFIEENELEKEKIDGIALVIAGRAYKPSHDSLVLTSTLLEVPYSHELGRNIVLLEIGGGSGYVTLYLCRSICSSFTIYAIMTDIDQYAVYSSWLSAKNNEMDMYIDVVQCESASCIRGNSIDVVYFNPPYLPVCDNVPEAIVWNGGRDGIEVWKSFFDDSLRICRDGCLTVFVFSSLQNLEEIMRHLTLCKYVEINRCQSFFYETICSMVIRCRG